MTQNPARPLVVVHIDAEPFTHTHDSTDSTDSTDSDDGGGSGSGSEAAPPPGTETSNQARASPAARPTTIGSGWVIPGETARRLACDCRWQIIVDDPNGRAIGISRESRRIPPWLSRVVARRDEHRCRWPRCERTVWLEHHHVIHWANGCPTDENNLVTVCWHRHHMLHEGHWTINPGTRDITIRRPDGRTYTPPTQPDQRTKYTRNWLATLIDPPPRC